MRLEERPASSFFQRIPAISATPRSFLAAILSVTCVLSLTVELPASAAIPAVAKEKKPKADPALKGLPITELSPDEAILHALNRLAYGPRPGDVERVQQMGLAKWIEQQLNPNSIDDRAMEARLQDYPTLRMSTAKLIDEYPQPKQAEKQAQQVQAQARQERRRSDAAVIVVEKDTQNAPEQPANSEAPAMTSASAPQPWPDNPSAAAPAKSPAMLLYLDNFLSVDPRAAQRQAAERAMRQQRRRGGFGWPPRPTANPQQPPKKNDRGLNENYGRELMELHTLGVDGGYTQNDVTEVARAFTGWTIGNPRDGSGFRFDSRFHDPGEKVVLGHRIKAGGGERDGEQVLDILAKHPSTAHFVAMKLARRFVSDTPPPALVDRAAKRFSETDGDLREVMRTILTSP